jgi:hypothetical protein
LALAVQFDWKLKQLDVSNAFLHGILAEDVYMEQSQGFVDPAFTNYVCKLHKALYGLKQAPCAWFTNLSHTLLEIGFSSSQVDPSLFVYHTNGSHIFLLVYVDDIIVTGNSEATMQSIIAKLQIDFAMKDLGTLTYFLGIQTIQDSIGLHLRQSKYIQDLLTCVAMSDSKPYRTPCTAGSKMSKFDVKCSPFPSNIATSSVLCNMSLSHVPTLPTRLTNSASTCTLLRPFIGPLQNEYFAT